MYRNAFSLQALLLIANVLSISACKTSQTTQSSEKTFEAGFENYERLPEFACVNRHGYEGINDSFNIDQESIGEVGNSAQISDDALGFLFSHEMVPCSSEVASALSMSMSQDIASQTSSESNSFGLVSANPASLLKNIRLGIAKIKGSKRQIKLFFANGRSAVVAIGASQKNFLLSSRDRIKLFPESNWVKKYLGPRIVKSEVATISRYEIIMRSLERNRGEQLAKFKSWLGRSKFGEDAIRSENYVIQSTDPIIVKGMESIFDLVSDPKTVFVHLQSLEIDIAKRMATKGETMEVALEAILTAMEKKHKFQPAYDLKNLTQESFQTPALFRDNAFSAGSAHGIQIHRIQWNVVMRNLEENPFLKNKVFGSQLYVEFGKGVPLKLSSNATSGWAAGWNDLFDGFSDNFGRPEEWRYKFTEYLPTLAGWP